MKTTTITKSDLTMIIVSTYVKGFFSGQKNSKKTIPPKRRYKAFKKLIMDRYWYKRR